MLHRVSLLSFGSWENPHLVGKIPTWLGKSPMAGGEEGGGWGNFRTPHNTINPDTETLRFFGQHRLAVFRRPNVCFRRLEDASRFLRDASSTPPRRIILIPNPMHVQVLFPLRYFIAQSLSCIPSNTASKYKNMQKK